MKHDLEVLRMRRERAKGRTQEQAAACAGMSVRTAGTYERLGRLPSQLKQPRQYRTRPDPFEADWSWIVSQLQRDSALQATTLFALLQELRPGRYQAGQVRTLQEHIAAWRAQHGPSQEVLFPQIHRPGVDAQSDFTHMESLGVTLGGVPFPHLVFHLVLSYSNIEAIQVCFSESFESLVEGIETCHDQVERQVRHTTVRVAGGEPTARGQHLPGDAVWLVGERRWHGIARPVELGGREIGSYTDAMPPDHSRRRAFTLGGGDHLQPTEVFGDSSLKWRTSRLR